MEKLPRISTKTGDGGETGLGDGSRTPKNSPRVRSYGEVDEANSALGLAISLGAEPIESLKRIQEDLFALGADLSTPGSEERLIPKMLSRLEADLILADKDLPPLQNFVLPGGPPQAAALHLARAIVRRAERAFWELPEGASNVLGGQYLNRLSDYLFVLARANGGDGEARWEG
ncbi:cob(I)yrinic acid a,c-diamide adenosyltransferase [bacterium]|nr:cob(I)yrinic acid a,c-diamide adenosyltransferase [bacterium]